MKKVSVLILLGMLSLFQPQTQAQQQTQTSTQEATQQTDTLPRITGLRLTSGNFTKLNVQKCDSLKTLNCADNKLTSLDVKSNSVLQTLNCNNNKLASLDVSGLTKLDSVKVIGNPLVVFTARNSSNALFLDLPKSVVQFIDLNNSAITQFSLSYYTALKELDLGDCRYLESLSVYQNSSLTKLNVSGCSSLRTLSCFNNKLQTLDVSGLIGLTYVNAINNPLIVFAARNSSNALVFDLPKSTVQRMDLSNSAITQLSLSGYSALEELNLNDCRFLKSLSVNQNRRLAELNISGCTSLNTLDCSNNQLTGLDVESNTALLTLDCSNNQLTSLYVDFTPSLQTLNCTNNRLTSLDVSVNEFLHTLDCSNNQLTNLDVKFNAALQTLNCINNQIASLDVSGLNRLYSVKATGNPLKVFIARGCGNNYNTLTFELPKNTVQRMDLSSSAITQLSLSGYSALGELKLSDCRFLKSLSVNQNGILTALYLSGCTSLDTLSCSNNKLQTLDISNNTSLKTLNCANNQLATLNVNGLIGLNSVNAIGNPLKVFDARNSGNMIFDLPKNTVQSIDLSNSAITRLSLSNYTVLSDLNLSDCRSLKALHVNYNSGLTKLNISACSSLDTLLCPNNKLQILDASANTSLKVLCCSNNQLTTLNVSGLAKLTYVDVANNPLVEFVARNIGNALTFDLPKGTVQRIDLSNSAITRFSLSNYTVLSDLNLSDSRSLKCISVNQNSGLTKLNISGCISLDTLSCINNKLQTLDVSTNTTLKALNCANNQLKRLDVKFNTALQTFNCSNNQFDSLNVSNLTGLTYVDATNNPLKVFVARNIGNTLPTLYLPQVQRIDLSNSAITRLSLSSYSSLSELNLSDCRALRRLSVEQNSSLTKLNLSGCTSLDTLSCINNKLQTLDVSTNTALKTLNCANNKLTSLDVSNLTGLTYVNATDNPLVEFIARNSGNALTLYLPQVQRMDLSGSALPGLHLNGFTALKELNLSDCRSLEWLKVVKTDDKYYYYTNLESLNIRGCTSLTTIACYGGKLQTLDVSTNTALRYFYCQDNKLTSLDVSRCKKLQKLNCFKNQLTSLDLQGCDSLQSLKCYNNQLVNLNVQGCDSLKELYCADNQLDSLNVSGLVGLTYVDATNNPLKVFYARNCGKMQTFELPKDEIRRMNLSGNAMMQFYLYEYKAIEELDLSNCKSLVSLNSCGYIYYNSGYGYGYGREECVPNLTKLNVSGCTSLSSLKCIRNKLQALDASWSRGLKEVYCSGNQLKSLNTEGCDSLSRLECYNNQLASLDLSTNTMLKDLSCYDNQLTNLNLSGCTSLDSLWCHNNKLQTLDIRTNASLKTINCSYNLLTGLNVSRNTDLKELQCNSNKLTALEISQNTALEKLKCGNNQLSKLDVSKNTNLIELYCANNQIADTFDVSNRTNLCSLNCSDNKITVLNVRGCTSLGRWREYHGYDSYYEFRSYGNPLVSLDVSQCRNVKSFPGSDSTLRFFNAENSGLASFSSKKKRNESYSSNYLPKLEMLNFNNCTSLEDVTVSSDSLRELKVKDCNYLYELSCKGTKISQLDMTGCTNLRRLYLDSNQLRTIQGNSSVLQTFQAVNNHLPFSQLYPFIQRRPSGAQYRLSPQVDTVCLALNEAFDLHKEMRIGLAATLWDVSSLDDAAVPAGTCVESNGVFRFSKTGDYKLVLLNESLQDFHNSINSPIEFIWYVKVGQNKPTTYALTVLSNNPEWGTVTATGTGTYAKDEQVTIVATPADGYRFVNWKKGEEVFSVQSSYTFKMKENLSLTAYFEKVSAPERYTVSVQSNNPAWGTVSMTGNGTYNKGEYVAITATPLQGYRFVKWVTASGDEFAAAAIHAFQVIENLALTAQFEAVSAPPPPSTQYTISVSSNNLEWGTVTIGGSGTYEAGADVTIVATAKSGYKFVNWKKGDEVFSDQTVYTFKATENLSLVAYFESTSTTPPPTQYTVSVSSNNLEWGTVTIGGSGTYEENVDVTIVATAKSGYKFVNWKKGDEVFSDQAVYTFKATENLSLVAYFEPLMANEDLQENDAFVYTRHRVICLSEPMGVVRVFNMFGQCVYSGTNTQIPVNTSGLYVVRTRTRTYKVVVK